LIAGEAEHADMVICGVGMEKRATGGVVPCEGAFNPGHIVEQAIVPQT